MDTSRVLQRVREAAQDVREAANSCKVIGLKDEGHSIAQKAQEVLSKIEERVSGVPAEQQQQQQQEEEKTGSDWGYRRRSCLPRQHTVCWPLALDTVH
jgi:hypothetical protein